MKDEIENATDDPTSGLEWSRGIFVNPGEKIGGSGSTSRIDEGTSSIDRFSWLKNRHKWDWWQKSRQPRQPWASTAANINTNKSNTNSHLQRNRRRRRRRRLVTASWKILIYFLGHCKYIHSDCYKFMLMESFYYYWVYKYYEFCTTYVVCT